MDKVQDLLGAIRSKSAEAVRRLLDTEPALMDARGPDGVQAALTALYVGAGECARMLIDAGASLDVFSAAGAGETARLTRLLAEDPSRLNAFAADGWTPLHLAAFFGETASARLLLERGADLHAKSKNPTANTPLHAAAVRGHRAMVELLIEHGAGVSGRAGGSWTPLHLAAGAGHEDVARVLVEKGADLTAREDLGRTPLGVATGTHHERVAALLRKAGGQ